MGNMYGTFYMLNKNMSVKVSIIEKIKRIQFLSVEYKKKMS